VRSLTLGLDEGSIGAAGVAAAAFHLKKQFGPNLIRYIGSSETLSWLRLTAAIESLRRRNCGQHTFMVSTIDRLGLA